MTAALAAVMMSSGAMPVHAHSYKSGSVEIRHPWTMAVAELKPGSTAVVIMKLKNMSDKPERLLSATAPAADKVVIVGGTDAPGSATAGTLDLPAGQAVELKATAAHIRLEGLKAPLNAYDHIPLTLVFERSGTINIDVAVEEAAEH